MPEDQNLAELDEYGDAPKVAVWDDGNGVEIDAPGCGTAQLPNAAAKKLLNWLLRWDAENEEEASVNHNYPPDQLYDADPNCKHEVVAKWSGVKCRKCTGWFC